MAVMESIVETAKRLSTEGYFGTRHGSGGNVSMRPAAASLVSAFGEDACSFIHF